MATGKKLKRLHHVCQGRCIHCDQPTVLHGKGKKKATRDHIIPKSKGGSWTISNLILACETCNNDRADMYLDQYQIYRHLRTELKLKRKWSLKITALLYELMGGATKDSLVTSDGCKPSPLRQEVRFPPPPTNFNEEDPAPCSPYSLPSTSSSPQPYSHA